MKLKILKEIVGSLTGKPAANIVDLLIEKKNVNEFNISKKLSLTINQTRNILYKLSNVGLISFIRKKDKRKGWYTYYWTLNIEKTLDFLKKKIVQDIEALANQLKSRQTKNFYVCSSCKMEVGEENALLHNFVCPECGQVYESSNSSDIIKDINSKINLLKQEYDALEHELMKEREITNKKRQRKQNKEAREKKAKRDAERKKRQKAKQREKAKAEKKIKKRKEKKKKVRKIKKKKIKKKKFEKKQVKKLRRKLKKSK